MNSVTGLSQRQPQGSQTRADASDWRQKNGWPTSWGDVVTKKDKIIFWAGEHRLSVASIVSRFLRGNEVVSEAFILRTAREAGILWGEYRLIPKLVDMDDPLTARIRKLVALGYGVYEIICITHKKESVIMQCMIAAQIGRYDDDGYFFIDPAHVDGAVKRLIDVESGTVDGSRVWCWYQIETPIEEIR